MQQDEKQSPEPSRGTRLAAVISAQAGPAVVVVEDAAPLPVRPPRRFIGRDEVLERLAHLLREPKTVLLMGVDGIGKTALVAAAAAQRLQSQGGEMLWLPVGDDSLAGLCDRAARAYGEPEAPQSLEVAEKTAIVRELLIDAEPLVVLDDVRNPKAAREFVRWCTGGLSVIASSRHALPGFEVVQVEPLKRTDARAVFCLYAGMDMPPPGDQLKALDALCEKIGDHPYGLELAGKLTAAYDFSPVEVLAYYDAALPEALTEQIPPNPGDGREHIAVILHASLAQLKRDGPERAVLLALGAAFDRGGNAELLAPVAALDEEACEDALRTLAQLSIAQAVRETRYMLRRTVHTYVRLTAGKAACAAAEKRLVASAVDYAGRYARNVPSAHRRLDAELGNLMGAVVWAERGDSPGAAGQMARALFEQSAFLDTYNYIGQALTLLSIAVNAARKRDQPLEECAHLNALGVLYAEMGHFEAARTYHEQALDLAHRAGDLQALGGAFRALGTFYLSMGDLDRAVACYDDALAQARAQEDRHALGLALTSLAAALILAGEYARAAIYQERGAVLSREAGDTSTLGAGLANLGNLYRVLEAFDKAETHYKEAIQIARDSADLPALANRLNRLGDLYRQAEGEDVMEKAAACYMEALKVARKIDAYQIESESLGGLGRLYMQQPDEPEAARDYYRQALEIARDLRDRHHMANWLFALGELAVQDERWDEAAVCFAESEQLRRTLGDLRAADGAADRLRMVQKKIS